MRGKKKKETDDAALFLLTAIDDSWNDRISIIKWTVDDNCSRVSWAGLKVTLTIDPYRLFTGEWQGTFSCRTSYLLIKLRMHHLCGVFFCCLYVWRCVEWSFVLIGAGDKWTINHTPRGQCVYKVHDHRAFLDKVKAAWALVSFGPLHSSPPKRRLDIYPALGVRLGGVWMCIISWWDTDIFRLSFSFFSETTASSSLSNFYITYNCSTRKQM
jgi:hypothetical protein